MCREATYQKSEEIFDDFEVEVGQTSKRVVYFQDIESDRSNFKFDSLILLEASEVLQEWK